jgi:DNA-directed RNA polymerase subunit RPC12/RpoP
MNQLIVFREHMQNVHTRPVKKVNPLQCSRCQDDFPDSDELKGHELNVDCAIRCPDCGEGFLSKVLRQEHQKENHLEDASDPLLRELDDTIWKQVRDNLKIYTDSLKNKKGGPSGDPDPERERWVLANTPRYERGRATKLKANSKLELGQWYTMFTTLAPNTKVLDHPCE